MSNTPLASVAQVSVDLSAGSLLPDTLLGGLLALVGGAVTAFLTTLVVGGLLIALAPRYTDSVTDELAVRPVNSLLYGVAAFVFLFLATFVLAITGIGLLVAIPLFVATVLLVSVGAALGYLTVGYRAVGSETGQWRPLLLGAGLAGVLTLLPLVGVLVSMGIAAAGFGAVFRRLNGDELPETVQPAD